MLDFSILTDNIGLFLEGFKNTAIASILSIIGSLALGVIVAVSRIVPVKILNWLGTAFVEFIRNIPLLIIIFFFFVGMKFSGLHAGILGLTIYYSTFIAEAIRAGILSVSKGQMEAALSSGLSYGQAMRIIILPQAIKIVLPPIGNQFLNIVKNTSLLAVVAGFDLMYQADLISSRTFVVFDVYIFVAVFYLIITIPLSIGVGYLEKRLAMTN